MAEQAKHTPGPWEYDQFLVRAKIGIIADPFCESVPAISPREMAANGCLIATAPELLEALRVAQQNIDMLADWANKNDPILARIGKRFDAAELLIAKAEGKE